MFVVNYMDRVNIGFAKDELSADTGLSAAAFGVGAGIFFIAYAIFEVPSNILMERFGARIWLTRIMISWGVVATAMAFVNSAEMFYVLRFLLGVAEAGFFPAVIYYFSRWLPDSHRGRATSIFLMGSGTATVIVGPISGALMEMHGLLGHAGWQWMFFIEGLFSVALGFVVYRFLDNSIESADWLTDEEKQGLVATIDAEQAARESKRGTAKVSRWKLLADPQMLLFLWIYFAINVALYAVTFWLPSIVDDVGDLSEFQVGLLTSVPWLFAIAAVWVSGRISDRMGKRRPLLITLLLIGSLGTLLAVYVSPWLGLGALCIAAVGFKPASPSSGPFRRTTWMPAPLPRASRSSTPSATWAASSPRPPSASWRPRRVPPRGPGRPDRGRNPGRTQRPSRTRRWQERQRRRRGGGLGSRRAAAADPKPASA